VGVDVRRGWLWRRRKASQEWVTRDIESTERTLRVVRWMAARRSRHEFDLGAILLPYTRQLAEAGRHAEALVAVDEAIDIGRRNIKAKPLRHAPNLAASLMLKAYLLKELGHLDEAVNSMAGSIDIYRTLVPGDPNRFEPVMFIALTSLAAWRHRRGEIDAAAPAFAEAVELARRLPDDQVADRAMALNNHGVILLATDRPEEAVPPLEEAVTLRRRLTSEDRTRFEPDLVASLRDLEQALSRVGRYVEAIELADELSALTRSSTTEGESDPS
jgi:tetratricopeptide (TPR) repeat protein